MSWEMISDVVALPATVVTVFIAVFNVIVKVNKTLCSLEIAVKQLKEYIEKQSDKNSDFYSAISDHEVRISNIEYRINSDTDDKGK